MVSCLNWLQKRYLMRFNNNSCSIIRGHTVSWFFDLRLKSSMNRLKNLINYAYHEKIMSFAWTYDIQTVKHYNPSVDGSIQRLYIFVSTFLSIFFTILWKIRIPWYLHEDTIPYFSIPWLLLLRLVTRI